MELHTLFGEIIRQKHGQRNFIIDLAWATTGLPTYYQGDVGLDGSDHRAQFISIYLKAGDTQPHRSKTEGWNWAMMRPDIIEVKAKQRLERIIIAEATLEGIDAAFDKLIQELTTIADLLISRRKPGIGKKCPWWCPAVNNAITKAKRDYRSYLVASTNFRWQNYKTAVALEKSTVEKAKESSWRRAVAATAHKQKDLWKLEKWARLRSWVPPESITIPPLQRCEGANNLQTTHQGKSGLLAERFFPKLQADIQELEAAVEQPSRGSHAASQRVTADEIEGILRNVRPWKAPGEDNIATGLLKACGKPLHQTLAALIISSFIAAYFPRRFKIAKITVLPKPNKTLG
jgi:hypothetical protein